MPASMIPDAVWSAGGVTTVILLLGTTFLLILQTPRFQYSLRFLVITIGCIALALGLWTAIWRAASHSAIATPIQWDAVDPQPKPPGSPTPSPYPSVPGAKPGPNEWNEYMDGPYQPKPLEPGSQTPGSTTSPLSP